MKEEITWANTRGKYTAIFGAPPQPLDDNDIGAIFRRHPTDIIRELERLATSYTTGKIHTPWRLLASKLDRIAGDHDHIDVNQDLRIRQAEAWIRNAGLYAPTETEVRDELFHATSALLPGLEAELGDRMIQLWQHELPRAGLDADA